MLDFQEAKTYLEKDTNQIASKKFCSKIVFEIKLKNIVLLKIFMEKHSLDLKKKAKK